MWELLANLRFALRQLRKAPAFAAVAILTLALGIGANTAVFSVMNAVLLQSLPVRDPQGLDYLKIVGTHDAPRGVGITGHPSTALSLPIYNALRARTDILSSVMAYIPLAIQETATRIGSEPLQAYAEEVSGNFFTGLTANMALGRPFTPQDEATHASVMVLSYGFWTAHFHRAPDVLGKTVYVKGLPFTVVGVTARGFFGVEPTVATDLWIPLQNSHVLNAWGATGEATPYNEPKWWCVRLMARLKPGITTQQAEAALAPTFMAGAATGVGTIDPQQWKGHLALDPAHGIEMLKDDYRQPIHILMGLVLLVLLIAVTNVGSLLMARNVARARELSLRLALGANRGRLLAQLLTESAILVASGAGLGWLLALGATGVLAKQSGIGTGLSPDASVLGFTLGISVLAAAIFAVAPLRSALTTPIATVLGASTTRVTLNPSQVRMRNIALAVQVAICLLLLTAAALLLRTLGQYRNQSLGMQANKVLVFDFAPIDAHNPDERRAVYRTLQQHLEAIPGAQSVSFVEIRPGSEDSNNADSFSVDGASQGETELRMNTVGNGYFATVGTPVLQGREFTAADDGPGAPTIIVNQSFADRYFPHRLAVGHTLMTGGGNASTPSFPARIIGVVADSRYRSVDETPMPTAYLHWKVGTFSSSTVAVRASGDPMALLPAVRKAVAETDPNVPVEDPMTQQQQFELSYAQPAMFATLGGAFGALAAILVAAGLYGTLAYRTARRRTEIGLRMALGAQRTQVMWLVLRESLGVAVAGLALGLPLTYFGARALGSLLWKLSPADPVSFACSIAGVLVVVLAASFVPAQRAASVEPAEALRNE